MVLVPEAATQLYSARGTRWDLLDTAARRQIQLDIYHFQRRQEAEAQRANPGKVLLLDRGTLDGSAYWPDGPADYWRTLGVDAREEMLRYHAVILLASSAALGIYDGEASNQVRFENAEQALASGQLLRELWGGHPRLIEVAAMPSIEQKITCVKDHLARLVSQAAG